MTRWTPVRAHPLLTAVTALAVVVLLLPSATAVGSSGGSAPAPTPSSNIVSAATLVAGGYVPAPGVQPIGALPASAPMTVLVGLPSQNPRGFAAYEDGAYIPGTQLYHQFLSPAGIAARFGASSGHIAALAQYFGQFGLSSSVSPDGLLMSVRGPSGAIGNSFDTSFNLYRDTDGRTFFTHVSAARLPGDLATSGVFGLGNVTTVHPTDLVTTSPSQQVRPSTTCSPGDVALSPCQIWGAYDSAGLIANGTNGAGERIAVVDDYDGSEPQSQLASDLTGFDSVFGLPDPTVTFNYPVPTTQNLNLTSTGWGTEEALDIEWTHASAPGASIAMTFAPNSGVGLYLAVDWLVSHRLADVVSMSWGEPDVGVFNAYSGACTSECNATSDGSYAVLSPVLAAGAVEGISMFVATGDCGSSDGTSGVSTDYPASDPSATGVGGTYLSVSSSGAYQSEVGWDGNSSGRTSPGCQNQGGSGGGYSPFPRPYWQHGSGLPTDPATRGLPDVSADASNGVEIVAGGGEGGVGGTSLSAPIWAGIGAISDQYAGHDLGLLGPSFYAILRGANYSVDFHDVTSGNNGYSAGTGWDPVTGVGTPIVANLVRDLSRSTDTASNLSALLYSSVQSGAAPLTIQFGIAASGGTSPYPLEGVAFGDGTSTLAVGGRVAYTYDRAGVYAASAFVADASGNLSTSDPVAIVVGGGSSLNVTLVPSSATPSVDAAVTFTSTVSGGTSPYSYIYAFGDGTFLNLTSSASVVHAYGSPGSFCAEVIAEDAAHPIDGARSAPRPIAVGGAPSPTCSSASAPLTVGVVTPLALRDAPADYPALFRVSGGVTGPGGVGATMVWASSDPYIAACTCTIFRNPGTYSVSLTATDLIGDRASNATTVTVAPELVAQFTTSVTYGVVPLSVTFGVHLSGGVGANASETRWNFGDGTTATGAGVSHEYTEPGFYSATGDAMDQGQGNASEGFLIDVLPASSTVALTATFAPAVNVVSGTTVHFSAHASALNGSAVPAAYSWSLGENASAWGPAASFTYFASSGVSPYLDATVTAHWSGTVAPTEATLATPQFMAPSVGGFVAQSSALAFSADGGPSSGVVGVAWTGSAELSGPGAVAANWTFGDGSSGSAPTANHTYLAPGQYTVNATGSDSWNDTAVVPFGVEVAPAVRPPLSASGGPSTERGLAPLSVTFEAAAAGGTAPYTYVWFTGDGPTNANATFVHLYSTPGTYAVNLTVRDAAGGAVQLNWTVTAQAAPITNPPPGSFSWVVYAVIGGVVIVLAAVSAVAWNRRRPPLNP